MKKNIDKEIFITIIISAIIFMNLGIYAANSYVAGAIQYDSKDKEWNVNNVDSALSDLYTGFNTKMKNLKDFGDAESVDILEGKTAFVKGNLVTGTMKNNGKLDWAPTTATTYDVLEGYYSGGTLDSSIVYQSGYNEGYNAGKATGADALLNLSFTVKLPMKNEFKNSGWDGSSSASTTYTFTYNKGTSSQPSSSTATKATYGSQEFNMYCSDAVPRFISNNEFWVIFTIKGHLVVGHESSKSTTYIVKYKWTDDKTAGTVTVVKNDIKWESGSYTMTLTNSSLPTVTVS